MSSDSCKKAPTTAFIYSQKDEMVSQAGEHGFDAGEKICGRKRHLLLNTLGLIFGCVSHQAGLQDRDGAKPLKTFLSRYDWLKFVFVHGGYAGCFLDWIAALPRHRGLVAHVVHRILALRFVVLSKRRIVEPTII